MIFYFTGTGNSMYAAQKISQFNNDKIISIAEEMKKIETLEYDLEKNEIIGFVYPVYAWGPPKLVLDFINRMRLHNYKDHYVFSIATCGENIGNTMDVLQKALKHKEIILNSGFSITMPNNYIIVGDVDSQELEKEKLLKAEERLQVINQILKQRKKDVFEVQKGFIPGFLTKVINPLFNTFGAHSKKFYATDECTSCGLCEKVCCTGNITVDRKPVWGSNCTQCLACIHRCPVQAIQYGKRTINKGRYKHPDLS
ncbi:EFR1 family ferrodoxin [Clostridiaceae bacterium 35-E11]